MKLGEAIYIQTKPTIQDGKFISVKEELNES